MDEWVAFRRIRLDPLERLIEVLKRGFMLLACSFGGKPTEETYDHLDPQKSLSQVVEKYTSPEDMAKLLAQSLGKISGNSNR